MSYIKLKFFNRFRHCIIAWQEIEKLMELRNRLLEELSSNRPKYPLFDGNLTVKKRNYLMLTFNADEYESRIFAAYEMKNDVQKLVTALIKYIEGDEQSESFDVVKSVNEEQIDDTDFTDDKEIESFAC